jgi:hypothetical protein
LRDMAHWKLPTASPQVLDTIPLVNRPKKLALGELANHRGKKVDDLIVESVKAHLEHSNFNNTDEIGGLLISVGIEVARVNSRFPDLQKMMKRRHQIVHRADRQDAVRGRGDHKIRGINKKAVRDWAVAVEEFGTTLLAEV